MDIGVLRELNDLRAKRKAAVVVTDLDAGSKRLVESDEILEVALGDEIERRLRSGKSGIVTLEGAEYFIEAHVPPPRLVIIGAVHISQALAPMARACDFAVTIIDPRTAFATPERFAGIDLHADWPEEVLKDMQFDAHTAVAAVTHDPKIDDIPLKAALDANCFYVGALGSRKTHQKRLDRLAEAGVAREKLKRIDAPIGMDIGAASPAEIAVAVLARVIESLRKSPVVLEAAA